MSELICLERRRASLRVYHLAVAVIALCLLGMLYLLAAIPRLDPTDADAALFGSYRGLIAIDMILATAAFSILSAVMGAKLIAEEYAGKRAILILSCPVRRERILGAKLTLIFAYTAGSMLLGGGGALLAFLLTESVVPLCLDFLNPGVVLSGVALLFSGALTAVELGALALWIGWRSTATAIVSAVILASVCSQLMTVFMTRPAGTFLAPLALLPFAGWALWDLTARVRRLEV